MPSGNFAQEVEHEIERLETRVERLRGFLDDMKDDIPESPDVRANQAVDEDDDTDDDDSPDSAQSGPARRTPTRPNEDELVDMLVKAPTNKNGSVDLRTDAGRTLRAFGMVDQIGFPTEEAEELLKTHKKVMRNRKSSRPAGRR